MTEQGAAEAIARLRSLVWEANGLIEKLSDYGITTRLNATLKMAVSLDPPPDYIELMLLFPGPRTP